MRFRSVSPAYRDRLLDAMALLLVDLHRGGVYWGDCSLANTLFRRDGDRIQAYLVDAETSEVHPSLSDGQRRFDLDILVENVAFGLADLAAYQGRRGRHRRGDRRRRVRPRPLRGGVGRALRPARAHPRRPPARSGPGCGGSTTSASRSTSRSTRWATPGRCGSGRRSRPAATTRTSSSGGRSCGRSRARRGSCSTTSPSTTPGSSSTSAAPSPPEEAAAALAARGLPADARADHRARSGRTATWSRPTATSSSTSGCCPSAAARRRAAGGDRVVRGRGGAGPGADRMPGRQRARLARRGGRRPGLGGRRLELAAGRARPRASAAPSARGGRPRPATGGRPASAGR